MMDGFRRAAPQRRHRDRPHAAGDEQVPRSRAARHVARPRRRGLSMLRDAPIRAKVVGVLLAPLLGLVVLAGIGVSGALAQGRRAGNVNDLAWLAVRMTALVHELQAERTLSSAVAADQRVPREGMVTQRFVVDRAGATLRTFVDRLDVSADRRQLRTTVGRSLTALDSLERVRGQLDTTPRKLTAETTQDRYTEIISALLDVNAEIAVGSNDEAVIRAVTGFVTLSRLKDATDLERSFPISTLQAGDDPVAVQQRFKRFIAFVTQRETWEASYRNEVSPGQRALYDRAVGGPDIALATRVERTALLGTGGDLAAVARPDRLDRVWFAAMTRHVNQLRSVERELAAGLIATSKAAEDAADRRVVLYVTALLGLLAVTVALSALIARSMTVPLRDLEVAAVDVARRRLPEAVRRIHQQPVEPGPPPPAEPAPLLTRVAMDEIGQVAQAFGAVHHVAVRLAAEQAGLRRSIAELFTNLARRSQLLVSRALELIDELEQDETDPDTLNRLFNLDHLVTRLRRNAENLVVLAGAELPHPVRQPVQLTVLLRSAIAEVRDYQRVELLPVKDVTIAGRAAVDLIHLLAELIENATRFSPPETKVVVAGEAIAAGYVVEIEDVGVGMSSQQLADANRRLADPPAMDDLVTRMLGLHVVGHLAARHGVRVQLRHSWYGGITALVLLPSRLLAEPAPVSDPQAAGFPPWAGPAPDHPSATAAQDSPAAEPGSGLQTHLPLRHHLSVSATPAVPQHPRTGPIALDMADMAPWQHPETTSTRDTTTPAARRGQEDGP
jgi:signal transduction histidine kinase